MNEPKRSVIHAASKYVSSDIDIDVAPVAISFNSLSALKASRKHTSPTDEDIQPNKQRKRLGTSRAIPSSRKNNLNLERWSARRTASDEEAEEAARRAPTRKQGNNANLSITSRLKKKPTPNDFENSLFTTTLPKVHANPANGAPPTPPSSSQASSSATQAFIDPSSFQLPKSRATASAQESLLPKATFKDVLDVTRPAHFASVGPVEPALVAALAENEANRSTNRTVCPYCGNELPEGYDLSGVKKRPSIIEQYEFCQQHINAPIILNGIANGYPRPIDFAAFRHRVDGLLGTILDWVQGDKPCFEIQNQIESINSDNTATTTAARKKAAQSLALLGGVELERRMPGYYGPRGAEIIASTITDSIGPKVRRALLSNTVGESNALKLWEKTGGLVGFVQSVLVPQVGAVLIAEDRNVSDDKAREIQEDSSAYGWVVNGDEE